MIQFDEHMFQMGWFNHQLDEFKGFFFLEEIHVIVLVVSFVTLVILLLTFLGRWVLKVDLVTSNETGGSSLVMAGVITWTWTIVSKSFLDLQGKMNIYCKKPSSICCFCRYEVLQSVKIPMKHRKILLPKFDLFDIKKV